MLDFTFPFVALVECIGQLFSRLAECCTLGVGQGADEQALIINNDGNSATASPLKSNSTRNGSGVSPNRQGSLGPSSSSASSASAVASHQPNTSIGSDRDRESHGQSMGRSQDFLSALRCLNIVMATCASCEFIQMTLLFFNWVLGYAGSQSQTVGPVFFYW
jgi:hypothetical protein